MLRYSVGKSKRNEVNRTFLLPVWETIGRKADILVRIEKVEVVHRGASWLPRVKPRDGALERRRSLIHSNSASNSPSRRSNNCSVLSIGSGVVISTPAAFNVSSGNLEPPERKNFR